MHTATANGLLSDTVDLPNRGTMSKVDKFGWRMKDAPGRFSMLKKNILKVNEAYQRGLDNDRANGIAQSFMWAAFGTLSVIHRDGQFWVFDGMHRLAGAMKRSDVNTVPCMIYEAATLSAEAEAFVVSNNARRLVGVATRHKAGLLYDEPLALAVNELLQQHNLHVGESGAAGSVQCIAAMRRLMLSKRELLLRVFPLVVQLCEGRRLHERLLTALVYIEEHALDGASIMEQPFHARVLSRGYEPLLQGANKHALIAGKGGPKTWAAGVVEVLNKGARLRLRMKTSQDIDE
jgi:hypothetical protein